MISHAQKIVAFLVLPMLLIGCSSLHRAAFEGDTKTVLSLLDQGEGIDTQGRYSPLLVPGVTATVWEAAILGGHEDTVRALLDRGLPANQIGKDGRTPLHLACTYRPNQKLIKLLLERGADPNLNMGRGWTSLMSCVDSSIGEEREIRAQAAQLLLEHGADPNMKNERGRTALSVAAFWGNRRAVQLMLDHGAIASVVDYSGETPTQIAENRGFNLIAYTLRKSEEHRETGMVQTSPSSSSIASVPSVSTPAPIS